MKGNRRPIIALLIVLLFLVAGVLTARERLTGASELQHSPTYEYTGVIITMPEGFYGTWQVGEYSVTVDRKTTVNTSAGPPAPGRWVVLRLTGREGDLHAEELYTLPDNRRTNVVELRGVLEKIQGATWVVSGQRITVDDRAEITGVLPPEPGRVVQVRARREGTDLVAETVNLITPDDDRREVAFVGQLQAVYDNTWVVDGITVTVPSRISAPPLGTLVAVTGRADSSGRVKAQRVTPRDQTQVQLDGWLDDVVRADEEQWTLLVPEEGIAAVRQVNVIVPPQTPVDERAGLAQVGARVQVEGEEEAPDRVIASYARVVEGSGMYLRGLVTFIPADPHNGLWTVNETQVRVTPTTILNPAYDRTDFRVGDWVSVFGRPQPDGILLAHIISHSKR